MFKGVFTSDYSELVAVVMATTESAKQGLDDNRKKVDKTKKVYSDYRAISAKEAKLSSDKGRGDRRDQESIPVPPQLLTETQAGVISGYIISKLLSKPKIINVPQLINQPEVSTSVDNFMVSCQNKYDWRLKLNQTIHGMTRFGPSGIFIIPRADGIDIENITPGNGFYDVHKHEGMCIIRKGYDYLMEMITLNEAHLTGMGKKISEHPEILHHLCSSNYSMPYYEIEKAGKNEIDPMGHLSSQESLTAFLASMTPPSLSGKVSVHGLYKGRNINTTADGCSICHADDGRFDKVDAADKINLMGKYFEITFNTVHLDGRLANLNEITGNKSSKNGGRKKYLIMSIHGFPISAREITSEMIILSDLFLSADNEDAQTLVESLEATETYNTDFHRSMLFALKDLVDQNNIWYDDSVFTTDAKGNKSLKAGEDINGDTINPRNHMFEITSPAQNIAAISQTLPSPVSIADDVTGNNPMLSAQHTKGNRTAIEGQNLTANSESRFFVFAGKFYMTVVNALAKTAIDLVAANPSWIQVYSVQQDAMATVDVNELITYSKRYYQEQTGLIPSALGSPEMALAIINMFSTIPQLAQERDVGDIITYFAKSGGFSDFPELRRPHSRDERLKTVGQQLQGLAGQGPDGRQQLAEQLGAGNEDPAIAQAAEQERLQAQAAAQGGQPPI